MWKEAFTLLRLAYRLCLYPRAPPMLDSDSLVLEKVLSEKPSWAISCSAPEDTRKREHADEGGSQKDLVSESWTRLSLTLFGWNLVLVLLSRHLVEVRAPWILFFPRQSATAIDPLVLDELRTLKNCTAIWHCFVQLSQDCSVQILSR